MTDEHGLFKMKSMVNEQTKGQFVRLFVFCTIPFYTGRTCSSCSDELTDPMQCALAELAISQPHGRCSGHENGTVIPQCASPQCHEYQY